MPRSLIVAISAFVMVGCGGSGFEPAPAPTPEREEAARAGGPVWLATDWQATAVVDRRDSVVLTLPSGDRQIQKLRRHTRFDVIVDRSGNVTVRLDSIALTPGASTADVQSATWRGRIGAGGLENIRSSATGDLAGEITNTVRDLFPMMPRGGVTAGQSWSDSTRSERQAEIFAAEDIRSIEWRAGERRRRDGIEVQPLEVTEEFEQLGRGSRGGREMAMSAQGRRTGSYFLSLTGRLDAAVLSDSVSKLITIPSTRQAIPTMQYIQTRISWQ